MEYQIIPAGTDDPQASATAPRVRIAGAVYPLQVRGGDDLSDAPRQLGHIEQGAYGPLVQAYLNACRAAGVTARFNWSGIVNELGDFSSVSPPQPVAP